MKLSWLTITWTVTMVLFIGLWDYMRYVQGVAGGVGSLWTISGTLRWFADAWGLFPYLFIFALGFLFGHLFIVTPIWEPTGWLPTSFNLHLPWQD